MIKLNLGCGQDIKDGYINIDTCPFNNKVVIDDIKNLSFAPNSIDEIYAKDILEHLSLSDAIQSIKNWSNICKPGAKLFIQTTCIDTMIEAYMNNTWTIEVLNYMLFAGKNWVDGIPKTEDFHKSCYSKNFLEQLLLQNQFKILSIEFDKIDADLKYNPYAHNLNIMIKAIKL